MNYFYQEEYRHVKYIPIVTRQLFYKKHVTKNTNRCRLQPNTFLCNSYDDVINTVYYIQRYLNKCIFYTT